MLIAGLITVVMGISIVGCGNDGKSTRETESTEQVTETEMATEEESEAEDTGDIKAEDYKETYRKSGAYLKSATPDKLITFHPFWKMSINNVYRRT